MYGINCRLCDNFNSGGITRATQVAIDGKTIVTVLCSVTRPLNKSKAGVDLALIQTSLLYVCNVSKQGQL